MKPNDVAEISSILRKNTLADKMTPAELHDFVRSSLIEEIEYEKGGAVFHEGDSPEHIYILISGKVRIEKDTFSGRHILLTTLDEPGDMFGEVYFILKKPFEVHTEATPGTRILALSGELMVSVEDIRTHLLIQRNLLRIFAQKAYAMHQKLQVLNSGTLREKIARMMFQEMDTDGILHLTVSRESLADWLAVTRPALSRELGSMQRDGIIRVDGRRIEVADMDAFERYL